MTESNNTQATADRIALRGASKTGMTAKWPFRELVKKGHHFIYDVMDDEDEAKLRQRLSSLCQYYNNDRDDELRFVVRKQYVEVEETDASPKPTGVQFFVILTEPKINK